MIKKKCSTNSSPKRKSNEKFKPGIRYYFKKFQLFIIHNVGEFLFERLGKGLSLLILKFISFFLIIFGIYWGTLFLAFVKAYGVYPFYEDPDGSRIILTGFISLLLIIYVVNTNC
jgi:hypothetical protein